MPQVEYRTFDTSRCGPEGYEHWRDYLCTTTPVECEEGLVLRPPLEIRRRTSASGKWSEWEYYTGYTCGPPTPGELVTAVERAFTTLKLTAPPITVIDGRGWSFVQIDTVIYADAGTLTHTASVLGHAVTIEATPTSYSWDFGDGAPALVTDTPGGPYPNKSVSHKYTKLGSPVVTLTTTWTGRWRLPDEPWRDFNQTLTTTSESEPFTLYEAKSRLVDEPLKR